MAGRIQRLYRGETRINFIGNRRRWYAASGVIILICVLSFILRGFNYSIEFSGGSEYQIQIAGTSITTGQVNQAFTEAGTVPQNPPQVVGSGSTKQIVVQTKQLSADKGQELQNTVAAKLHIAATKLNLTSVSSSWGHDVSVKAIEGLIIFLIVVTIYISIRFQWRMAVGALVALLHDLIVAAGIYSLVGFEVSPSTVVGLLTILGFSLYDTVVVYDKVNENARDITAGSRTTYSEAANLAVNQTLMRSINTSLISLLPVAGLLFVGAGILGVGTIKDLALILFVGLASGAYSSLFLATPVVVELVEAKPEYQALTKRVIAKRNSDAARAEAAAVAVGPDGSAVTVRPTRRTGGPAPAPRPGARPDRNRNRPK